MSHPQFYYLNWFILRLAWLNLWDKHMTTGRINQVIILYTYVCMCVCVYDVYMWDRVVLWVNPKNNQIRLQHPPFSHLITSLPQKKGNENENGERWWHPSGGYNINIYIYIYIYIYLCSPHISPHATS